MIYSTLHNNWLKSSNPFNLWSSQAVCYRDCHTDNGPPINLRSSGSSSVTVLSNLLIWVFSVGIIGGYFTATGD